MSESDRSTVSIVAPVYNEEASLLELYRRISEVLDGAGESWEMVLVNDGSRDGSIGLMRELHAKDPRVKAVSFSRNFGHARRCACGNRGGASSLARMASPRLRTEIARPKARLSRSNGSWRRASATALLSVNFELCARVHLVLRQGATG